MSRIVAKGMSDSKVDQQARNEFMGDGFKNACETRNCQIDINDIAVGVLKLEALQIAGSKTKDCFTVDGSAVRETARWRLEMAAAISPTLLVSVKLSRNEFPSAFNLSGSSGSSFLVNSTDFVMSLRSAVCSKRIA